jgi:hypothetical protein
MHPRPCAKATAIDKPAGAPAPRFLAGLLVWTAIGVVLWWTLTGL